MAGTKGSLQIKLLEQSADLTAKTWPVAARVFPEQLEIDENRALWVSGMQDYTPRPPLRAVIAADVAIIGGGFTGVSTAYQLSARFPNLRIVLLEAATLANGASGRNGGMILNWVNGIDDSDLELLRRTYRMTSDGIAMILEIIQRHQLNVDHRMDGTITVYTDAARAESAHAEVERHNALGIPTVFLPVSLLRRDFGADNVYGAVLDPGTGQINGAQLVREMGRVLDACGVEIYEHSPVIATQEGNVNILRTPQGEVRAKAMVIATNGYTGKLGYFRDALFPLHSHVFATEPLTAEQRARLGWRGLAGFADDLDRISYASMTTDGHLVFGGGSNQAYSYCFNNRTVYPGGATRAQPAHAAMAQTLANYFPESRGLPIRYRWAGALGITMNRQPLIGVRGEHRNVYYAVGYCGHGVTLANVAGKILCDLYSGDETTWGDLPFVNRQYHRIPPEPFRWFGYQMFTRLTGKSPRV